MTAETEIRWTDVPAEVVLAAADLCDGHGIFDPIALIEVGVPQALADRYTDIFESDFSNPKSIIFDNKTGEPVKSMAGVYGLNVLSGMVRDFKLEYEPKFGRGFQAQIWKEALHKHLGKSTEAATT